MSTLGHFDPGAAGAARPRSDKSDLDTPERIARMVELFYGRLLADPKLAPLFLEVARVNLDEHLPIIAAYWRKMLLREPGYDRHMMAKHRALDDQVPLTGDHHERWLAHFYATLDEHFHGSYSDRARRIAARVIDNLYRQLSTRAR